jgi:hypothetical protein
LLAHTAVIFASPSDGIPTASELVALLDCWTDAERLAAFAQVYVMFNTAYGICDSMRTAKTAEWSDVSPLLKAACPGFSEKSYLCAYEKGMLESR